MSGSSTPPIGGFVIPELKTLRELRIALARGGVPAPNKGTPADSAKRAAFRTICDLLHLFEELRRRITAGQCCRIVERKHATDPGRLVLEFEIVEVKS